MSNFVASSSGSQPQQLQSHNTPFVQTNTNLPSGPQTGFLPPWVHVLIEVLKPSTAHCPGPDDVSQPNKFSPSPNEFKPKY
jgi:hypothetical protein